jgi:hypothetical protein
VASIKVETAGTKTSSYTLSVTREYPHLSTNDTELVPKTVDEKGKTYNLAGVEWRVGNYSTVDYERIADYYTAVATYTATGSSTKVTGYVTTAEYKGVLSKLVQGGAVYTAYFLGEEIRTPLEMTEPPAAKPAPDKVCANLTEHPAPEPTVEPTPEPTLEPTPTIEPANEPTPEPTATPAAAPSSESGGSQNTALYIVIALLSSLLSLLLAGGAFYLIKNRKGNNNYEETTDTTAGARDDGGDGDTRSGG